MSAVNNRVGARRREPLTNATLLMLISIGIFVTMYAAAMIFINFFIFQSSISLEYPA